MQHSHPVRLRHRDRLGRRPCAVIATLSDRWKIFLQRLWPDSMRQAQMGGSGSGTIVLCLACNPVSHHVNPLTPNPIMRCSCFIHLQGQRLVRLYKVLWCVTYAWVKSLQQDCYYENTVLIYVSVLEQEKGKMDYCKHYYEGISGHFSFIDKNKMFFNVLKEH